MGGLLTKLVGECARVSWQAHIQEGIITRVKPDLGNANAPLAIEGADILLVMCGRLQRDERLAIICDSDTRALGDLLADRASRITTSIHLVEVPPLAMHGAEPTDEAADEMRRSDLCLGITAKSMIHTQARQQATSSGARYLSLPDYSFALLADDSLRADFDARSRICERIANVFTKGDLITVSTPRGTRVSMSIRGRTATYAPGFVAASGQVGSPPDIEAYVAPLETSAEGDVVVDGSIPFPTLGLVHEPVHLTVRAGRIVDIKGETAIVSELERVFETAGSSNVYVLAECGVGLNDRASLTGVMLTDEGAAGTIHFGFGSNSTMGGTNNVSFHLDMVMRDPSLEVDGVAVIDHGELRI